MARARGDDDRRFARHPPGSGAGGACIWRRFRYRLAFATRLGVRLQLDARADVGSHCIRVSYQRRGADRRGARTSSEAEQRRATADARDRSDRGTWAGGLSGERSTAFSRISFQWRCGTHGRRAVPARTGPLVSSGAVRVGADAIVCQGRRPRNVRWRRHIGGGCAGHRSRELRHPAGQSPGPG